MPKDIRAQRHQTVAVALPLLVRVSGRPRGDVLPWQIQHGSLLNIYVRWVGKWGKVIRQTELRAG